MKLRIKDSSFRFRITLEELDLLCDRSSIECVSRFPDGTGLREFRYAVEHRANAAESALAIEPYRLCLVLSTADLHALLEPAREGVYIRRETADAEGQPERAMVFIEKDRPGSTCDKPEEWIYRENTPGQRPETRRIQKS
jgi:hypothetical protein